MFEKLTSNMAMFILNLIFGTLNVVLFHESKVNLILGTICLLSAVVYALIIKYESKLKS